MVFTSCSFAAPEETKCSMQVEIIEGLRKHRKVTLRAEETHELQAVAWRLQEMGATVGGRLLGEHKRNQGRLVNQMEIGMFW